MRRKEPNGKVVSFDQSGTFFYKRARRMLEDEHMIEALSLMRKAVEKEPENVDFAINLAEIYTEMDCFAESNQILFPLVHRRRDLCECYFGMGVNFFGMRNYEKARESLLTYISMDDSAPNYDEAQGLLVTISLYEGSKEVSSRVARLAERAANALSQGDNLRAARLCERVLSRNSGYIRARTLLCEAYIRMGKLDQALRQASSVLARDPGNVDALCHVAVSMSFKGMTDEAAGFFQAACASFGGMNESSLNDLQKIGMAACMLDMHEQVYQIFRKLNKVVPYNKKVLHYLALACMNTDRAQEAEAYWSKALRLDPGNTIFSYYLTAARHSEDYKESWEYDFQVPPAEILNRIIKISETLQNGFDAAKNAWKNDPSFAALMKWGLTVHDPGLRRNVLFTISSFGDEGAERVLRQMLTSQAESDSFKREILVLLKKMDKEEPYIAYINQNIVEVSISVLEASYNLPKEYARVLEEAADGLAADAEPDSLERMIHIWTRYYNRTGVRRTRLYRRGAWVAALHFVYLISVGKKPSVKSFLKRYNISARRLNFHVGKILEAQD